MRRNLTFSFTGYDQLVLKAKNVGHGPGLGIGDLTVYLAVDHAIQSHWPLLITMRMSFCGSRAYCESVLLP